MFSNEITVLEEHKGSVDAAMRRSANCSYKAIQTIFCEVHFPPNSNDDIKTILNGENVEKVEIIRFWIKDTDNMTYLSNYVGKYIDWCGWFWKIIAERAVEVCPCEWNVRITVQRIQPRDGELIA